MTGGRDDEGRERNDEGRERDDDGRETTREGREMGGIQYEGRLMSGLKCGREQIEWITGVELRGYEGVEQCKCWENYSAQATVGGLVPSPPPQLLSLAVQEAVVDNWEQEEAVVDNWEQEEAVVDNWEQDKLQDATYHFTTCRSVCVCVCVCVCMRVKSIQVNVYPLCVLLMSAYVQED